MLYISRRLNSGETYGVVDTDDGVETLIRRSELYQVLGDLGIEVAGVVRSPLSPCKAFPNTKYIIEKVFPFQLPEAVVPIQTKYKMLFHTDVVIYNDEIQAIRWMSSKLTTPVVIRLSSFASSVGEMILWGNLRNETHKATLIFDDNLNISPHSFSPVGHNSSEVVGKRGYVVVLDLREVSNDELADEVYRQVFSECVDICMLDWILDDDSRKRRWMRTLVGDTSCYI